MAIKEEPTIELTTTNKVTTANSDPCPHCGQDAGAHRVMYQNGHIAYLCGQCGGKRNPSKNPVFKTTTVKDAGDSSKPTSYNGFVKAISTLLILGGLIYAACAYLEYRNSQDTYANYKPAETVTSTQPKPAIGKIDSNRIYDANARRVYEICRKSASIFAILNLKGIQTVRTIQEGDQIGVIAVATFGTPEGENTLHFAILFWYQPATNLISYDLDRSLPGIDLASDRANNWERCAMLLRATISR